MRNYNELDPRTELEQTVANDLRCAFEKKGFTIIHNGGKSHAPGRVSDIEMYDENYHFNVEVTQLTKTKADREFLSIKAHLEDKAEKKDNCFCIYISPETPIRIIRSIKDYNSMHDSKILPLSFENFYVLLDKFSDYVDEVYPITDFINVFDRFNDFTDDQRVMKVLYEEIFSSDVHLGEKIRKKEIEKDQKTLEMLIEDLISLENKLREKGIATGSNAIDTLIYLVFIKLFEEKREKLDESNRFKINNFKEYKSQLSKTIRENNTAIHELFRIIKIEFTKSKMFDDYDKFTEDLTDDFIIDEVIPIFDKYPNFIDTKIDALGAVYEVLARRAEKDVKLGQFFTPEKVVEFMINLADLNYNDIILDPACGTGRFLIWAMRDMEVKLKNSSERNKRELLKNIKSQQLYGSDLDLRIAKIAKMNMWVHGDGKSNIFKYNGLLLKKREPNKFDNGFDVVLTNPPLGDLDYTGYDDEFLDSNKVVPKKNKTLEELKKKESNLKKHIKEKINIENELIQIEKNEIIIRINSSENNNEIKELKKSDEFKQYEKLKNKLKRKNKTIELNNDKVNELKLKIKNNNCEMEVTGKKLKGGALFLNSINDYLKKNRQPEALPEWRGGVLVTVIDEGVLNTKDYYNTREFLINNFYIKAIISLSRDTFVPISNTSTKTSIIYAIKKEDIISKQQEPIFYGYVDKVGMDTKGKICDNHLDLMLDKYNEFKVKVLNSYDGKLFNQDKFNNQ